MSAFQWNNPSYLQELGAIKNNLAEAWFKVLQYYTEKCNKCKMVIHFKANLLHICPEEQIIKKKFNWICFCVALLNNNVGIAA